MQVLYFGCVSQSGGHYLYSSSNKKSYSDIWALEDILGRGIDSGLLKEAGVPDVPKRGVYIQRGGYSVVSWWDRGGDSRGASNSAFIAEGAHTADELIRAGIEAYPFMAERAEGIQLLEAQP